MTQEEACENLAQKTAREFLDCSRHLGLTTAETLAALEHTLLITMSVISVMNGSDDHKRFCLESLDILTERCAIRFGHMNIQEIDL